MTSEEKDLLLRVAPAYIFAAAYSVYAFFQIRNINRQREQANAAHEAKMADMKVAANERIERFHAWRATQPKTVEDFIEKAKQEVGSVEDLRRKMADPNHVFEL